VLYDNKEASDNDCFRLSLISFHDLFRRASERVKFNRLHAARRSERIESREAPRAAR